MAFHNIPPNGFPDIPDMEELEAVVKDVSNLSSSKANQITIAPFFDPETAYEVGDLVYYNGLSYQCTNDHEGEWDADDFAATTVSNELATLKSGLTNRFKTITSGSLHDITQSGTYYLTAAVTDRPAGLGGMYILSAYNDGLSVGMYVAYNNDVANRQVSIVTHHDEIWEVFDIVSTRRT